MLQVADFVSGSLARVVDPGKKTPCAREIQSLILKRSVGIEVWPPRPLPEPGLYLEDTPQGMQDEIVRRHCIRQAQLFVAKHGDSATDEDLQIQLKVLEMLLFGVQFADPREYAPSARIIERLRDEAGMLLGERQLRSAVSSLRDAGVVIGTSQKGYKIPVSEADVAEFVTHANTIVPPMLARLRRARTDLRAASIGKLDILASQQFDVLRALVDALPGATSLGDSG